MLSVAMYPGAIALTLTPCAAHSLASAFVSSGHPSLARRIAGNRDPALEREQRGDEDDLSLAPLDHPPPELACQDELGREVHLEHAVPELVRMLDRGAALDRPGVEDEDVHERAVSRHLLGELENGLSLPEVAAVGPETTASCRDLGSDLVCRLQGATDADDICAGICECDGRRLADPTPAAGHEGCLSVEGQAHVVQSTRVLIPVVPAASSAMTTGSLSSGSTALIRRSTGSTSAAKSSIARSKSSGSYTRAPRS